MLTRIEKIRIKQIEDLIKEKGPQTPNEVSAALQYSLPTAYRYLRDYFKCVSAPDFGPKGKGRKFDVKSSALVEVELPKYEPNNAIGYLPEAQLEIDRIMRGLHIVETV